MFTKTLHTFQAVYQYLFSYVNFFPYLHFDMKSVRLFFFQVALKI